LSEGALSMVQVCLAHNSLFWGAVQGLAALAGTVALTTAPKVAQAYPVLLPAKDLPWMMGAKREHLLAIAKAPDGTWRAIPSQAEEIEEDVAIVFREPTESLPIRSKLRRPKKRDPFEGYFEKYHRLILDDKDFGPCDEACQAEARLQADRLCDKGSVTSYSRMARIDLEYSKSTAFLVDCQAPQKPFPASPTIVDRKTRTMSGRDFSFHYKNDNSVMLDTIKVGKAGERKDLLVGTEMRVFLKPKFMFNLEFANEDVHAEISSITHEPLSHGVEIATALNVMVFQFNKQICCDINIFDDSIYFPVMLDLPYNGDSFVPGSGLFYGFNVTDGTQYEFFPAKTEDGSNRRATRSATAMTLTREGKIVTIGFGNLKGHSGAVLAPSREGKVQLAAKGFTKVKNDEGIFYDVTKLPEGFNYFTVWMYVGDVSEREKLLEYARHSVRFSASRVN
jgi:hypothetical protein